MEYIRAFLVGGIICILVQILMDHTTLQPGRIMVLLVIAGVILGALGIYKRIEAFGGLEDVVRPSHCLVLDSVYGKE